MPCWDLGFLDGKENAVRKEKDFLFFLILMKTR